MPGDLGRMPHSDFTDTLGLLSPLVGEGGSFVDGMHRVICPKTRLKALGPGTWGVAHPGCQHAQHSHQVRVMSTEGAASESSTSALVRRYLGLAGALHLKG